MRTMYVRHTLAAVTALALAGCGYRDVPAPARTAVAVHTQRVASSLRPGTIEGVGSMQSAQDAVLASKVMGSVLEIRKRAGDSVRRGEVLVVIDSRDVAGQVAQAEGALAQARAAAVLADTNLKRFEQLLARGSASQLEADQARFQSETARGAVAQAEGAVATARSYQSYTEIASPFDGRVVDRLCEVGDLASPGRPLLRVENEKLMRLYVSLDAEKAVVAIPGTAVDVDVPSLGDRRLQGTVAEVVPAADPATRSILVKIDMEPDPALRTGVYGRALFATGPRAAIFVPRSAVRERGGLTGVFMVENAKAAFRLVTTSEASRDSLEILSGLSEGETLIITPPATLEADAAVEVQG